MYSFSRRTAVRNFSALSFALTTPFFATSNRYASAHGSTGSVIGEFVGVIEQNDGSQPDILVAVVAEPPESQNNGRLVRAYLCNGADLAEWFAGEVDGNSFTLTSKNGATMDASLSDALVTGSVTLSNGDSHDFVTKRATGIEGLFLVTQSVEGAAGASSRGVLWQYGVDEDGLLEGIFVLRDGTIEPISATLPTSSLAPEQPESVEEADVLTTNRLIVVGHLPEPRIAGAMVDPRPRRCRPVQVTLADGTTQIITVCKLG